MLSSESAEVSGAAAVKGTLVIDDEMEIRIFVSAFIYISRPHSYAFRDTGIRLAASRQSFSATTARQ